MSSSRKGASSNTNLRFYTDDTPGLKLGPTTVLIVSIMYVGFVVLLHMWGKLTRPAAAAATPAANTEL